MESSPFSSLVKQAEKDLDVYCPICHKVLFVKAGEVIPRYCGKIMEPVS